MPQTCPLPMSFADDTGAKPTHTHTDTRTQTDTHTQHAGVGQIHSLGFLDTLLSITALTDPKTEVVHRFGEGLF